MQPGNEVPLWSQSHAPVNRKALATIPDHGGSVQNDFQARASFWEKCRKRLLVSMDFPSISRPASKTLHRCLSEPNGCSRDFSKKNWQSSIGCYSSEWLAAYQEFLFEVNHLLLALWSVTGANNSTQAWMPQTSSHRR